MRRPFFRADSEQRNERIELMQRAVGAPAFVNVGAFAAKFRPLCACCDEKGAFLRMKGPV